MTNNFLLQDIEFPSEKDIWELADPSPTEHAISRPNYELILDKKISYFIGNPDLSIKSGDLIALLETIVSRVGISVITGRVIYVAVTHVDSSSQDSCIISFNVISKTSMSQHYLGQASQISQSN